MQLAERISRCHHQSNPAGELERKPGIRIFTVELQRLLDSVAVAGAVAEVGALGA